MAQLFAKTVSVAFLIAAVMPANATNVQDVKAKLATQTRLKHEWAVLSDEATIAQNRAEAARRAWVQASVLNSQELVDLIANTPQDLAQGCKLSASLDRGEAVISLTAPDGAVGKIVGDDFSAEDDTYALRVFGHGRTSDFGFVIHDTGPKAGSITAVRLVDGAAQRLVVCKPLP